MKAPLLVGAVIAAGALVATALLLPRPAPEPAGAAPAEVATAPAASSAAMPATQPAADFVQAANTPPGPQTKRELFATLTSITMAEHPERHCDPEDIARDLEKGAGGLHADMRDLRALDAKLATSPPSWHFGINAQRTVALHNLQSRLFSVRELYGTQAYRMAVEAGILPPDEDPMIQRATP